MVYKHQAIVARTCLICYVAVESVPWTETDDILALIECVSLFLTSYIKWGNLGVGHMSYGPLFVPP